MLTNAQLQIIKNISFVFILLIVVGVITVGNALAVTFTDSIVAESGSTHALIKAESSAGSAIFRMNDVGTKIFDIQVLDGKARMDFVDRSLNLPRLTVSSDGNIGIGTTLPAAKLEVVDNTSEIKIRSKTGSATINVEAVGGDAIIKLKDSGTRTWEIKIPDGTGNLEIKDATSNQVRMSISPAGQICIGSCP